MPSDLLNMGPLVLSFFRGSWCPYCNLEMSELQRVVDEVRACGANIAAVSPQSVEESGNMQKNAMSVLIYYLMKIVWL